VLVLASAGFAGACFAPDGPKVVSSHDPSLKIPAIKTAVDQRDFSTIRQMIKDLESDDPAVRFYASSGLERLTGETFGYHYFVDEAQRAPAVEKWTAWAAGWEAGARHAVQASSKPSDK
jgi:hypothetical protein